MKLILKLLFLSIMSIGCMALLIMVLPMEVLHWYDIKQGNKLIAQIEEYKKLHHTIPADYDYETLRSLGFAIEMLGTNRNYSCDSQGNYELIFIYGFDGPHLVWNSRVKNWKMSYPTIFSK